MCLLDFVFKQRMECAGAANGVNNEINKSRSERDTGVDGCRCVLLGRSGRGQTSESAQKSNGV